MADEFGINERSVGERILDAVDTLRGNKALTTLGISHIQHEKKSAPDYGQTGWRSPFNYRIPQYYRRTEDFRHEVGNLDANSLVMCVVNYTGTRLPEAKPTVSKKGADGKMQPDPLHALARLIRRPNKHFIWANYCLALSLDWWTHGNVAFLKDRSQVAVEQLWFLPWFLIRPRWPNDGGSPEVPLFGADGEPSDPVLSHYQYSIPGRAPVLYEKKDIVHLKRGVNLSNIREGIGAFEPLITELYGDKAMGKFTASIMRNMGIQVPIISPKDKEITIKAEDALAMKESWIHKTTGDNAGEPVILTEPIDVQKFGFSPTELDLSKLRLIPESRVAAVTGIPAATLQLMVGLMNGTSYASSAQARQQGYEEVIIPIQQAIAEEITWQLLIDFEKEGTAEFSFDTSEVRVLQEDKDALFKRNSVGYLGGWLMRSDARRDAKLSVTADDEVFFDPRGGSIVKEGEDITGGTNPSAPAKGFGSVADIEKYLGYLETEMKDFVVKE